MAEVSDLGAFALGFGTGGFDALTYRNRIKKSDELRDESLRGQAMRNADFLKNIQHEADQESARLAYDLERFRRSASTRRGQQALNEGPVQPGVSGAMAMGMRAPVRYAALESVLKRMTPEQREQVMADFEVDKYRQASEEMRKNLGQRIAASTRTGAYSRDGSPSVDPEMQAVLDQYQEVLQAKVEFQTPDEAKDYTDKLAAAIEAEAAIRVKFNKEKALIQQKQSLGMKGAASMADLESKGFDVTPLYNVYSLFMADAITAEQYQKAMAGAKVEPVDLNADNKDTRPVEQRELGRREQFIQASGGVTAGPGSSAQVPTNGVPRGTPAAGLENAPGMIEPGNVNLSNRPNVQNRDGTSSSVLSASFNIDGQEVLLPTISDDGRKLSSKEAVALYKKTGKHLGKFDTPKNATAYAERVHQQQAGLGKGRQQTFKQLVQQVKAGAGIEETANALGLDPDGFTEDEEAILRAVLGAEGEGE